MSKAGKIISYISGVLLVLLATAFSLSYFVYRVPLFDQSGWFEADSGNVYHWDYYGKPQTGWQTISGRRYFFDPENGIMHTGWLDTREGRRYFAADGAMQTGWIELPDGCYFLEDNGVAHIGWMETGDGDYYFDARGTMQTGWLQLGQCRYYLAQNGIMHTGWVEIGDGRWFFDEQGIMQTGWVKEEDARYYLCEDGAMATGFLEVGGIKRYFLPDGAYIPLVNNSNPVPEGYKVDPVAIQDTYVDGVCLAALKELKEASEAAGYSFTLNSAYRSIEEQQQIWDERRQKLKEEGYSTEAADQIISEQVTVPGFSEHQLGLAVDIRYVDGLYDWLAENSWQYGFILRYPEDKMEITGISYEPWHFRYVGKTLAKDIFESGLCLEEYLQKLEKAQ